MKSIELSKRFKNGIIICEENRKWIDMMLDDANGTGKLRRIDGRHINWSMDEIRRTYFEGFRIPKNHMDGTYFEINPYLNGISSHFVLLYKDGCFRLVSTWRGPSKKPFFNIRVIFSEKSKDTILKRDIHPDDREKIMTMLSVEGFMMDKNEREKMISKISRLIDIHEKYKNPSLWDRPLNKEERDKISSDYISKFLWVEGGHLFSGEFMIRAEIYGIGIKEEYFKDGKKVSFSSIKDSYKRLKKLDDEEKNNG